MVEEAEFIDPNYEFDAPQVFDFQTMRDDEGVDAWFEQPRPEYTSNAEFDISRNWVPQDEFKESVVIQKANNNEQKPKQTAAPKNSELEQKKKRVQEARLQREQQRTERLLKIRAQREEEKQARLKRKKELEEKAKKLRESKPQEKKEAEKKAKKNVLKTLTVPRSPSFATNKRIGVKGQLHRTEEDRHLREVLLARVIKNTINVEKKKPLITAQSAIIPRTKPIQKPRRSFHAIPEKSKVADTNKKEIKAPTVKPKEKPAVTIQLKKKRRRSSILKLRSLAMKTWMAQRENKKKQQMQQKEEQPKQFKARPLDPSVLRGPPKGIRQVGALKLTTPVSPLLHTKKRAAKPCPDAKYHNHAACGQSEQKGDQENIQNFKTRPVSTSKTFTLKPCTKELTEPVPFSFSTDLRKRKVAQNENMDKKHRVDESLDMTVLDSSRTGSSMSKVGRKLTSPHSPVLLTNRRGLRDL